MKFYRISPVVAMLAVACGGDAPPTDTSDAGSAAQPVARTPAGPAAPTGALAVPDWYVVDHDARTVDLSIVAGASPDNNYWNFNGFIRGQIAIVVPEGYSVNVEFTNRDPNMAHSLGISAERSNFMTPPVPTPAFAGAITESPQSMLEATMPGETESIRFVAETAGGYSMVCFIAGHSAVGMWVFFDVSPDGEAGVRGL